MPAFSGQYKMMMRPTYSLMPTLSRLGMGQIPRPSHLPAADAAKVNTITSKPKYYRNQRDEVSVIPEVFAQAQALTTLGDRPLAVLTASATATGTEGWVERPGPARRAVHQLRAPHRALHPRGPARGRQPAAASVRAITEVISSVRTSTPLPAR